MNSLNKTKHDEIFKYIVRILGFCTITTLSNQFITLIISELFIMFLYGPIIKVVSGKYFDYWNQPDTLCYFVIFEILVMYFFTKIFGIFSKLQKLNFSRLIVFFVVFSISILLGGFSFVSNLIIKDDAILVASLNIATFLISFLLHKFFNFLTLKFPYPFKEIGYIFSFEYYQNLFLNKKINNEE